MDPKVEPKIGPSNTGHITVMRSHDYCHFEISLPLPPIEFLSTGSPTLSSLAAVNMTRKECARLVDKAVEQYKRAKEISGMRTASDFELQCLRDEVKKINETPENERTPRDKARIKALADYDYWRDHDFDYDYEDEQP